MKSVGNSKILLQAGAAAIALALVSGCGGGGGSRGTISTPSPQPTPTPSPTPTPAPTPTPTPTPSSSFNTAEFMRSDGPAFHNAVTAWKDGIDGKGTIIAVIDTGIDSDSPEFAGRLHPNSASVSGTGTVEQEDDHGTNVAMVAAAARDNTGILGIAFNADVLAIRADTPGSCAAEDPADPSLGCSFADADIAAGVQLAIDSGANVVNLSLGGSQPTTILRQAIARAAAAGLVIIVSAGNDGDSTEDGVDPNRPDPFAAGLLAAGGANVIIVGSVDQDGAISAFSNRAGDLGASFLTARGERICCVYENGEVFITEENGQRFVTLFSGTSFSAPQVAGAAALLAQAFPNLTGAQIVEILLDSARDAGATGTDNIYGRGIMDIARALAPAGTTRLAGTSAVLALADDTIIGSNAMGGALGGQSLDAVITDKYQRAYNLDLGRRTRGAVVSQRLHAALDVAKSRRVSSDAGPVAMAFSLARDNVTGGLEDMTQLRLSPQDARMAQVLAARVALTVDPQTRIGVTFGEGANGLVAQLQGHQRPAFLVAGTASGDTGFARNTDASFAVRHELGTWGVTASAETGEAWLGAFRQAQLLPGNKQERYDLSQFSLAADRRFGDLSTVAGLSWMREEDTVLGAYFHQSLGASGADSLFIDLGASYDIAPNWTLGAEFRHGTTRAARAGLIADGSNFSSNAWSLDAIRTHVFKRGDRVGLRVSQPLRVTGGGLNLNLPVAYDYTTESALFDIRQLSLAPDGREVTGELSWQGPLWLGSATAALFYRNEPGHYADSPADAGVAFSWSRRF